MKTQLERHNRASAPRSLWAMILTAGLILAVAASPGRAEKSGLTSLNIVVMEADTGEPVPNAQVTVQFRENPGKLKRSRTVSLTAKTNAQGKCKVLFVPKGTIRLLITAEQRQSFGREFEVEEEEPVIEVSLRRPQPLL